MDRTLDTLPIAQYILSKLTLHGFKSVQDLQDLKPIQLSTEAQISQEEALDVLDIVSESGSNGKSEKDPFGTTAYDLMQEQTQRPPIPTFCHALDKILGGGVPLKNLTELCGSPGSGKTQMCLQLCANVQIPSACGGLEGEAIFIDTEGSFVIDRLVQIVEATVDFCHTIVKGTGISGDFQSFTVKKVLEGIHYFHCKDYIELIARIQVLPEFLQEHPKVTLLVIDSICFHFRYGFEKQYANRTRLLNGLSQSLVEIANNHNMAVVVTNQMTTKVHNNEAVCVPALGKSWGHACHIRLIFSWNNQKRQAHLFKSPWKQEAIVLYDITAHGIRDFFES